MRQPRVSVSSSQTSRQLATASDNLAVAMPPHTDKTYKQPTPINMIHGRLDIETHCRIKPGRPTKQTVATPKSKNAKKRKTTKEDINTAKRTKIFDNALSNSESKGDLSFQI